MGRWRANNRRFRRKKQSSSQTSSEDAAWSWQERQQLIRFFKNYKQGIENYIRNGGKKPLSYPSFMIGSIIFPELGTDTFRRPYLRLPVQLTGKQRKMVHEVCAEMDLFHAGIGEDDTRCVAVSYYADGFDTIEHLEQGFHFRFSDYKPHFLSDQERETRQIEAVEALIDQPGDCIRDFEEINYQEMESMDLSDIEPPSGSSGSYELVNTPEKMISCAETLGSAQIKELGFDIEAFNLNKFAQLTCLIQLASDSGHEFVIDVLAPGVWNHVSALRPLFEDPGVVKIGHSIGGLDVKCLHRDFGIVIVNGFDTYEAVKILGLEYQGLAAVCKHYGLVTSEEYQSLKDKYQAMDWRVRPLSREMILYGRYDVHYLIRLRKLIIRDLTRGTLFDKTALDLQVENTRAGHSLAEMLQQIEQEEDDVFVENIGDPVDYNESPGLEAKKSSSMIDFGAFEQSSLVRISVADAGKLRMEESLMKVLSVSQERCKSIWKRKTESCFDNAGYKEIRRRANRQEVIWSDAQEVLYEKLVTWREAVANQIQCLPPFVCDTSYLLLVALQRPKSDHALRRLLFRHPAVLEEEPKYRSDILALVAESLKLDGISTTEDTIFFYKDVETRLSRNRLLTNTALAAVVGATAFAVISWTRKRKR